MNYVGSVKLLRVFNYFFILVQLSDNYLNILMCAVIHQFSGLMKFRKFCFQGNHDTPLICTSLGTLHGERGSDEPSCAGQVRVSQT